MKTFLYCLTMFMVMIVLPLSADAQFPKPRPSSAPSAAQAQQSAAPSPAPAVAAPPQVNVSPQLAPPPPNTMDEIKSWLNTLFAALITALLAKIGFRPAAPVTPVGGPVTPEANVLLALRDKVTDPNTRARIDETLLGVLGTGIPSKLTQAGLSAIPVAGPFAAGMEPMLHEAFMGFLKDRLASNQPRT